MQQLTNHRSGRGRGFLSCFPRPPAVIMIEKRLDELYELLEFPIYIYRGKHNRYEVDKITKKEERFERHRYLIEGNQCSCLSWMKIKRCKHLDWLAGNFEKFEGVPASVALAETSRLIEGSEKLFPESRKKWWLDAEDVEDYVGAIYLQIVEPFDCKKLVSIKNTGPAKLAICLIFDREEYR